MARYLAQAEIKVTCGIDAEGKEEAIERFDKALDELVKTLNEDGVEFELGAKFDRVLLGFGVQELPF